MLIVKPRVELLAHTPDPLRLIFSAYRQCYAKGSVAGSGFREKLESVAHDDMFDFVKSCMKSGHTSPLEHVSFTFTLSGVSRALTHQLVRHRIASYSQQSQRYVRQDDLEVVVPDSIANDTARLWHFKNTVIHAETGYRRLVESGCKPEDARAVLPNCTASNIVLTMNCRALLNFFDERLCTRAQAEIRNVAYAMLNHCRGILPAVFNNAGPKCSRLGYCPESKPCGKYPAKKDG